MTYEEAKAEVFFTLVPRIGDALVYRNGELATVTRLSPAQYGDMIQLNYLRASGSDASMAVFLSDVWELLNRKQCVWSPVDE